MLYSKWVFLEFELLNPKQVHFTYPQIFVSICYVFHELRSKETLTSILALAYGFHEIKETNFHISFGL